jgi:hypothetical protein
MLGIKVKNSLKNKDTNENNISKNSHESFEVKIGGNLDISDELLHEIIEDYT